jgi:hypothetical protein
MTMPQLFMEIKNPEIYKYSVEKYLDPYNLISGLTVQLLDQGTQGSAILSVKPSQASLKCSALPPSLRILDLCPPSRRLYLKIPLTEEEFVNGQQDTIGSKINALQFLPVILMFWM